MVTRPSGRPTDEPALAELRAWRSVQARSDGVPAYIVAPDALLARLVEERPGSVAALRRVKGMGPARLDRYGDEILAILARH
jgi:superfamily II DNA helicase RecQ